MAARFNKEDGLLTPRGSSLEADDGSLFLSDGRHLAKLYGGGRDECDSGVDMLPSIGCDLGPSLGSTSDPDKPKFTDLETASTCVSVGYFSGTDDVQMDSSVLEGQMERLDIGASEVSSAVTTTTSCSQTTPCPVVQSVDPRKALIDRVQLYFTPDDDGDTYVYLCIVLNIFLLHFLCFFGKSGNILCLGQHNNNV